MRFNPPLLLTLAALSLGALPACSGEVGDGDDRTDAGTNPGTDAGTDPVVDAGPDQPGNASCPGGNLLCETFESGQNGWEASAEHATIQVDGSRTRNGAGALHVRTENGISEDRNEGQAIARFRKAIPRFGTALNVRAHVYLNSLPAVFGQMGTFFVLFSPDDNDFGGIELQVISDRGFALDDWSLREGQGWNRQPTPVTVGMDAGRWVCLEWEVRRPTAASTHGNTRVFVDGVEAYNFTNIGMRNFTLFSVGYGFVHPKDQSGSEAWLDNVVVGTQRIGCE